MIDRAAWIMMIALKWTEGIMTVWLRHIIAEPPNSYVATELEIPSAKISYPCTVQSYKQADKVD